MVDFMLKEFDDVSGDGPGCVIFSAVGLSLIGIILDRVVWSAFNLGRLSI